MECEELRAGLHRYIDEELPAATRRILETHLVGCGECSGIVQEERRWQQAVRGTATYHAAPAALRRQLAATLQAVAPQPGPARRHGWAMAASLLLAVVLSSSLTAYLVAPSPREPLEQQIVGSHVRSLMADHLTDVVSSDQHTVKPWFQGRLDYAPPVEDAAAQGFPLVGGRLDYIDHRGVAALVYRHDKHPINLFVFPATGGAANAPVAAQSGYNVLRWTADGMEFWAVSDLNAAELGAFEKAIRR